MHGESEKVISIFLVNEPVPQMEGKGLGGDRINEDDDEEEEEQEEGTDVMFKIKLEKPDPDQVKISKRNACIVTIA